MRSAGPASIQVSLISAGPLHFNPRRSHFRLRIRRQLAPDEIGWFLELAKQSRKDLAVGGEGAWIGRWAIRFDRLMQLGQRVIGDRWENVVLDVVIHVPIQESEDGIHV